MELPDDGYSPAACLDFDFAVNDFWVMVESRREERVKTAISPKDRLKQNQYWGPKYRSDSEILDLYYGSRTLVDPTISDMTNDDWDELLDSWLT